MNPHDAFYRIHSWNCIGHVHLKVADLEPSPRFHHADAFPQEVGA